MAPPEKPSRLGRGLDALLARREPVKPTPDPVPTAAEAKPNAAASSVSSPTPALDTPYKDSGDDAAPTSTPEQSARNADARTMGYQLLSIASIAPNRFQPRKEFREQDLVELESSLRSQGLLQPITVRPAPETSGYELIAGERRLRAATRLGWKEIPAIVRETNDRTMLTLAMVENLQRADLDPIDEADGYQRLIDDFQLTQQEVADVVGKERSTVANALRLLALPASVKRMLQERHITVGHARALLPLETERAIADLARDVVSKSLSVRDVELRVRNTRPNPAKSGRKTKAVTDRAAQAVGTGSAASAEMRRVEELLRKKLQTTVALHLTGKDKGEVRIAFFSNDDLERVLLMLGVDLDS